VRTVCLRVLFLILIFAFFSCSKDSSSKKNTGDRTEKKAPVQVEEKNAAQDYIDRQKENIQKAKDAVNKSNEAQQKALEQVEGLE